ncbi:anti-silence-domain-containing protein, partial [Thelephora ganbajun]
QNVEFLNNPARFLDPYRFRVTFECIAPLEDDLEWRLIYVSSPGSEDLDQELDDCLVGPVPIGINAFEFEGCPPDPKKIPEEDVLGVAALILTGSYKEQEFVRVGYYQNTEWEAEDEKEKERPLEFDKLVRDINNKPRVTRFQIKWDVPQQPNLASAGAATSAAVPSADTYSADEDDEED